MSLETLEILEEIMDITESVLTSIKKMLGIVEEYENFDSDLIMHINSVFSILTQLGVGPSKGFMIQDKSTAWKDFILDEAQFMLAKSYMYLKVKLLFDPPLGSAVIECYNKQISEYEWRLNVAAENGAESSEEHEQYTGSYEVTPKAFESQTLETQDKILADDIIISEVPYYETANDTGGVTSYIAKEGNSK